MNATLASVVLLAAAAAAQTFVVDINNGPGTSFTSLATAVQAVPDGAVLVVRPGNYFDGPIIDDKSLTVIGQPGAVVFPPALSGFRIQNLAPQRVVVVRGLQLGFSQAVDPTLRCVNDQGLVFLDGINSLGFSSLFVDQCAAVLVGRSSFTGASTLGLGGVALYQSRVMFDWCTLYDSRLNGGDTEFGGCQLEGIIGFFGTPGTPPITMNGGNLRIVRGTLRSAGQFGGSLGTVIAGNGSVRLDTATTVFAGQPAYQPGISVTTSGMPWTSTALAASGTAVTASLRGPQGEFGVLVVGLRSLPTTVPGLDPWWLDVGVSFVQTFGIFSGGATLQSVTALPTGPGFTGQALVWQGLAFGASGALQIGNPSWFVLP